MAATYTLLPELKTTITEAEKARRAEAVSHAAGNMRAEGLDASPFMKSLEARYINGEITHEDIRAALHRRYSNNGD